MTDSPKISIFPCGEDTFLQDMDTGIEEPVFPDKITKALFSEEGLSELSPEGREAVVLFYQSLVRSASWRLLRKLKEQ